MRSKKIEQEQNILEEFKGISSITNIKTRKKNISHTSQGLRPGPWEKYELNHTAKCLLLPHLSAAFLFSLYEEESGGRRPLRLGEPPGHHEPVQWHTVERMDEFAPMVQIFDVPVPFVALGWV